ncbi:MAG: hypothetical protein A2504_15975 [Bdellovibrionales bacterium RIFOXYD12_FULL_39_22]|nr:MAG: hypothetical protein A2385_07885 [Bdellovibrionales bacterium RIFOXYB1_FULL_39_21]OFZ43021.1 MAG: hypothetical protein A2485_11340 [Bdellovibrionales bacterium RIFOXYC12_FULL_39_17]OFZ50893.1 MAG: hypothetical protein A2404_06800 [Bdellovibrionales bacterium RIFOXYC1_FULL_39_130]OFZ73630.1 MAG: hypothetical protein A2451_06330 [Bdellovibrionales bacterium RIFOXYC2_FULL_39_8]OFZ78116.1 MAG: hypothetical protein A2560_01970 [Bdellovibrionales bacterium RIFOXYD1_FULL_39_84]OFZ93984.1 MAG:
MKFLVIMMVLLSVFFSCSSPQSTGASKIDNRDLASSNWDWVIRCDNSEDGKIRIEKRNCYYGGTFHESQYCEWQAVVNGKKIIDEMRAAKVFYDGRSTEEYVIRELRDNGGTNFTAYSYYGGYDLRYIIEPVSPGSPNMKLFARSPSVTKEWTFYDCSFQK